MVSAIRSALLGAQRQPSAVSAEREHFTKIVAAEAASRRHLGGGLTDAQLKSGLPTGFASNIWGQSAGINNGYPYLVANPPPQ